ncbi:hypothetical protein LOD99_14764 [Oopsacas minuta]|uniref:3CxxC-type domain-containing protein n=1 Tax=Oopsacas minuta TaxID=111878 RepID=A0AAV7KCZ7_9METZ|nr:hypothetical protein LOD99_14764 [Oopsacas minuta]
MDPNYLLLPNEHQDCMLIPHLEFVNRAFDWSHRDKSPGRFFGRFQCDCGNKWVSGWTWSGRGQKCHMCTDEYGWNEVEYTKPYDVEPRMRRPIRPRSPPRSPQPRSPQPRWPHDYENCEYCAELSGFIRRIPTQSECEKVRSGDPYSRAYIV